MNYRAWNHRCWLVSYMTREQVLHELEKSRNWAGLHVADNCCFHYRRWLMLRILKDSKLENTSPVYSVEVSEVWKEELNWNERLIKRYIGREEYTLNSEKLNYALILLALWLHRRFLSLCWMKQFATNLHDVSCHSELKISTSNSFNSFIDNELHLLDSCSTVPDNDFEDFQVQATYSATYILWLTKQISEFWPEFQEKLTIGNLKTMLSKTM
nr:protein prenyltransferase alpha subunit repeat-containing protein 1-B-like [Quercus suber]